MTTYDFDKKLLKSLVSDPETIHRVTDIEYLQDGGER